MTLRTLLALSLAFALAPAAVRADDGDWSDAPSDDAGGWYDDQGDDGYDVSVDLDDQGSVDVSTFHQPLAAHGDWVNVGTYGNVWRPRVAGGWRPYYYGRWEWTTEGWLWVSDEPFGWATYHYGRWAFDRGYGWFWVPGTQWAPAWVSWRYSGDVVGWAPLAPGLSLYVTDFAFVDFWWTFVPTVRFCGTPVYRSAYAPHYSRRWWDATRPAPPRPGSRGGAWSGRDRLRPAGPAWGGPSSRFVEERAGRPIRPARIVPSAAMGERRGRPGEISVFRPEVRSRPSRGGEALRTDRGGGDRGRGRGWDDARPGSSRRAPAPGLDQPRRQAPGLERAPERARPEGRGGSRGRGWDDGRSAPQAQPRSQAPSRSGSPSWSRPERGGGRSEARSSSGFSASPRASSPPQGAPAPRSGGSSGGGQGGGRGSRPAPPSGERGDHRR